jgi:hypothetical protein
MELSARRAIYADEVKLLECHSSPATISCLPRICFDWRAAITGTGWRSSAEKARMTKAEKARERGDCDRGRRTANKVVVDD